MSTEQMVFGRLIDISIKRSLTRVASVKQNIFGDSQGKLAYLGKVPYLAYSRTPDELFLCIVLKSDYQEAQ